MKELFCPLPPTPPGQTPGHLNYCSTEKNRGLQIPVSRAQNRAFSNHVTAAILVFKATICMLVFWPNPVVVELSSHVNVFFCNYKLTQMLVTWMKTLYSSQTLNFRSVSSEVLGRSKLVHTSVFLKSLSFSFSFLSNCDRSISNLINIHCHRENPVRYIKSFRELSTFGHRFLSTGQEVVSVKQECLPMTPTLRYLLRR